MLIDLHAHSSGASRCCKASLTDGFIAAREVGLDGLALTNHYQKNYQQKLNRTLEELIANYRAEYERAEAIAREMEMRLFFGIEVTMERYKLVHMVIYGLDPSFLDEHPYMFDYTQEQLWREVHKRGGILIQAHPYRAGSRLMDAEWMDGVELNCHPLYGNIYLPEIQGVATSNRLPLTCGGDYHADTYRPKCGMYLPDNLRDTRDLADYIRSAKQTRLCVQDIGGEPFDMEYRIP